MFIKYFKIIYDYFNLYIYIGGASSTLMKEIAKGTYQYDSFNDIMNTIYSRFE